MIVLDDGELLLVNGSHGVTDLQRFVKTIESYQAHSVVSRTKEDRFITIKNRGSELFIQKMGELGINVKVCASSISGDYYEYTFVDEKDHFLFNLKFGTYRY